MSLRIQTMLLGLLWILTISGCAKSPDLRGNEGPGGGDVMAQQAASLLPDIYQAVQSAPQTFPEVPLKDLQKVIARVRVLVRQHTYANGVETDAVNNGVDLIELNGSRWPLIVERDRKLALLFHEVLGLMGLEKNNYAISNRLLSVKNRFLALATYNCGYGANCQITMRYDNTLRAFVVTDQNCGHFPQYPQSIYKRYTSSVYSINAHCSEEEIWSQAPIEKKPEQKCSVSPGGDYWHTITFMDGYEFLFTRGREREWWLKCRLAP